MLWKGLILQDSLKFNNKRIEYAYKEIHLGLARTSDGKTRKAVASKAQVDRCTMYSHISLRFHGVNGKSVHKTKSLVSTYVPYVNTATLNGLELLVWNYAGERHFDQVLLTDAKTGAAHVRIWSKINCPPISSWHSPFAGFVSPKNTITIQHNPSQTCHA